MQPFCAHFVSDPVFGSPAAWDIFHGHSMSHRFSDVNRCCVIGPKTDQNHTAVFRVRLPGVRVSGGGLVVGVLHMHLEPAGRQHYDRHAGR